LQKDAVIEYLQMPERVKNVELQLGALRGDLSRLTEVMSRLWEVGCDDAPNTADREGGKDYVS